ncbi:MAG: hypothetical protein CMH57_00405 [Myxococcales bacterium]|nr:hypothetical protein [Myxococcales bacterium]
MDKRIYNLIGLARLRLRLQRVMEGVVTGLIASCLVWMVLLVLYKTHWLAADAMWSWAAGGVVFPAIGLVWAFLHRIEHSDVAMALDTTNGLKGRLTSAYCFLELPPDERTPFMEAAIRESEGHLDGVRVAPSSPFAIPRDALAFVLVGAALGLVLVFRPPVVQGTLPPIVDPVVDVKPAFDDDQVDIEREKWQELREELAKSEDAEAQALAGEMDELFDKLDQKKLDKEKFLTEVDEIQNKFFEDKDDGWKPLLEELKKVSDEVEKNKHTEDLAKALESGDLDKVAEELNKLADKIDKGEISDRDLEAMARKLEKMASKFEDESGRLDKMLKDKEEELEALRKKLEAKKEGMSDKERKRLSRLERDLKKLRKKSSAFGKSGKKRALKRLSKATKEGSKMARSVKKRGKGAAKGKEGREQAQKDFKQNMGQASKELKNMDKQVKTGQSMDKAQAQINDMKEQIRRQGQQGEQQVASRDQFNQKASGQQPKPGQPQGAQPQSGQPKPGAQSEQKPGQANGNKASQKPGQANGSKSGQKGGEKGDKPGSSGGSAPGDKDGEGQDGMKGGQADGETKGKGIGEGEGDRKLGDATGLKDKKFEDKKVEGKMDGEAPVKSEVILSAASKGFATQGYKDVFVEYKDVAEEVLESEEVPPGYQFYVRRYFDMIRPRGDGE